MDELQRKMTVIHWLTDYNGTIIAESRRILVELKHQTKLSSWFITARNSADMLAKLDGFITNKVRVQ
jgi:hypothetical protein